MEQGAPYLHEVVLNHIADHAEVVKVAPPAHRPEVLLECDVHRLHVVAIPHGLQERVGEAKHEEVLHHLFTEVVINAVDALYVG